MSDARPGLAEPRERDETDLGFADERQYPVPALATDAVSIVARTEVITATRVALPRDYGRIMAKLKILAAMAGEDWYYRFPVKNRKENRTDFIEGPSIKCATAVAREYGNCAVDCRSQDQGATLQFLARFVDMETGFQLTRPFQQRKGQQTMRTDAERAADIVYQIGASKATRNVICNALEMFTNYAYEQAKQSLVEKIGKNIETYRTKAVARLADMGIDLVRVERILGKTAKEWLAPELARLIAEIQSINDGMASKDDLYPAPDIAGVKTDEGASSPAASDASPKEKAPRKPKKPDPPHDPVTGEIDPKSPAAQGNTAGAAADEPSASRREAVTEQRQPAGKGAPPKLFGE